METNAELKQSEFYNYCNYIKRPETPLQINDNAPATVWIHDPGESLSEIILND